MKLLITVAILFIATLSAEAQVEVETMPAAPITGHAFLDSTFEATDSFEIGTRELGPAIGNRFLQAVVPSRDEFLVVWLDGRLTYWPDTIYVARVDANGSIADAEGMRVAVDRHVDDVDAASDGHDFLLLGHKPSGELLAVRVSSDGAAAHPLEQRGDVRALAWNGQHYVALIRPWMGPMVAVLLDADGHEVSGQLTLRTFSSTPAFACRQKACFVMQQDGGRIRGEWIPESLFPPRGETAAAPGPQVLFDGWDIAVAATANGYVSVTPSGSRITVRYHSADGVPLATHGARDMERRVVGWMPTYTVDVRGRVSQLRILAAGPVLTVTYRAWLDGYWHDALATLRPRAASAEVLANDPPYAENSRMFAAGPGNVIAVWSRSTPCVEFSRCEQLYFGLRGHRTWTEGALLTRSKGVERLPRASRGTASILATWVEVRENARVLNRILHRDGRPAGPAVVLGESGLVRELLVAFDGVNYLVVWEAAESRIQSHGAVVGCLISQDGSIVRAPFEIAGAGGLGSLLWTGSVYAVTVGDQMIHLGASGVELRRASLPVDDPSQPVDYLFLDYDRSAKEYFGLAGTIWESRLGVGPNYYLDQQQVAMPDDLQWTPGCCGRGEKFTRVWWSAAPAVARGSGAGFAVIYDGSFLLFPKEPLPLPRVDPYQVTRMNAVRFAEGFVIAAGSVLSRHDVDGRLLAMRTLAPDATDSYVVEDFGEFVTLVQRQTSLLTLPRIEAMRVSAP